MMQPNSKHLLLWSCLLLGHFLVQAQDVDFSIRETGGSINLTWVQLSGKPAQQVSVERSADGVHFERIFVLEAPANCEGKCRQTFTDRTPVNGMNYYRIGFRDDSGVVHFSAVRQEDFLAARKPFKVLTAGSRITIQCRQNIDRIMAWSASGKRLVDKNDWNNPNYSFAASSQDQFVFLMLELEDGSRFTEKIGIQ